MAFARLAPFTPTGEPYDPGSVSRRVYVNTTFRSSTAWKNWVR